jgi:AcrR family transcriptional regulator
MAESEGLPQAEPARAGAPARLEDRPNLRADARRNRERVLQSAETIFAKQGLAVPIDEIARDAGVGVGTVYRHFPTKEALYEAIVVRHLTALAALARCEAAGVQPGPAFFDFLGRVASEAMTKRDLTEALANAGVDVKAVAEEAFADLKTAVGALLERAQKCGSVRSDVSIDEVFALVGGACTSSEHQGAPPAVRMVGLVCDALRPPADSSPKSS